LWSLPYYRGEVKLGTLLAMPVRTGDAVAGLLVADRLEIQAFTGPEPDRLQVFAGLVSDAIQRERASLSREEIGAEFKAVYEVSKRLAALSEAAKLCRLLLRSAKELVPFEAAAVVIVDDAGIRYVVEEVQGWAREFQGREVGLGHDGGGRVQLPVVATSWNAIAGKSSCSSWPNARMVSSSSSWNQCSSMRLPRSAASFSASKMLNSILVLELLKYVSATLTVTETPSHAARYLRRRAMASP
jgi:hypothetical protein